MMVVTILNSGSCTHGPLFRWADFKLLPRVQAWAVSGGYQTGWTWELAFLLFFLKHLAGLAQ